MVKVRLEELPSSIKGFTVYFYDNGEEVYTIVLNSRMSRAIQQGAYLHELGHIRNGDFHKSISVDQIERINHANTT